MCGGSHESSETQMNRAKQTDAINQMMAYQKQLADYKQPFAQQFATMSGQSQPTFQMMSSYLQGDKSKASSWMKGPDWMSQGARTKNAFTTIGNLNLNDAQKKMSDSVTADMVRRGLKMPSSMSATNPAAIQNWRTVQNAKMGAEGEIAAMSAEQAARQEQQNQFLTALQYVQNELARVGAMGDMSPVLGGQSNIVSSWGNAANQSQQADQARAQNQLGLFQTLGYLVGSNPQWLKF